MLQDNRDKKVVTRDGRPVRIVCTDATTEYPIIGIIGDTIQVYRKSGMPFKEGSEYDLFFADEEEELTEFEKEIKNWMSEFLLGTEQPVPNDIVKKAAKKVLDLARKELQPEIDKELDQAYKSRDEVVYLEGYDTGCEATLESLPKWKKATKPKNFDNHIILFKDKDRVILTTEIYEDEYYIELDDLTTLPKEE